MKLPWRKHDQPDKAAEQARYEAARAQAEELKRRAEQLDGWTRRAKRSFS